jgi:hypothetical protein
MSGVKFAQYVGIKYSTLAYWLKMRRELRRREKRLIEAGADAEAGKSNGLWVQAVVEHDATPRPQQRTLQIYFAGGAYCQISGAAEVALVAQLLGHLGSKR